jgi:hypothetical protein
VSLLCRSANAVAPRDRRTFSLFSFNSRPRLAPPVSLAPQFSPTSAVLIVWVVRVAPLYLHQPRRLHQESAGPSPRPRRSAGLPNACVMPSPQLPSPLPPSAHVPSLLPQGTNLVCLRQYSIVRRGWGMLVAPGGVSLTSPPASLIGGRSSSVARGRWSGVGCHSTVVGRRSSESCGGLAPLGLSGTTRM